MTTEISSHIKALIPPHGHREMEMSKLLLHSLIDILEQEYKPGLPCIFC